MATPIYLVSPKPRLGQYMGLAQRLHDMVVCQELEKVTPIINALTHWQQSIVPNVPFDKWEPYLPPHKFPSKYSPLADYGCARVHTASLFSPHDEILVSLRERIVTEPIGSRTRKPIITPSPTSDHHPLNITPTAPLYHARRAVPLSSFLNERVLFKLRSLKRGPHHRQFKRATGLYGSTLRRGRIRIVAT